MQGMLQLLHPATALIRLWLRKGVGASQRCHQHLHSRGDSRAGRHGAGRPSNDTQPPLKTALAPTAATARRGPRGPAPSHASAGSVPGRPWAGSELGAHADTDQYIEAALPGPARAQPAALACEAARSNCSYKGWKCKTQKPGETVPTPKQPPEPTRRPARRPSLATGSADGKGTGEAVLGSLLWWLPRPTRHIPTHRAQPWENPGCRRAGPAQARLCSGAGTGARQGCSSPGSQCMCQLRGAGRPRGTHGERGSTEPSAVANSSG